MKLGWLNTTRVFVILGWPASATEDGQLLAGGFIRLKVIECYGYRICIGRFIVEEVRTLRASRIFLTLDGWQSLFITIATLLATVTISPVEDANGNLRAPAVEVIDGLIA